MITNNTPEKRSVTINIDRSKYDALEAYFAMQNHTLGDYLLQDVDRKYGMVRSFAEKYFGTAVPSVPKPVPKRRPLPKKNPPSDKQAGSSDKAESDTASEGGDDSADADGG